MQLQNTQERKISESQTKDKNKNKLKPKDQVKKYYYCRKTGNFIKDCLKEIFDMKDKYNFDGFAAIARNNELDIQGVVLVT